MIRYQYIRFPGGKGKTVTLSYDDGCEADLRFSDIITKAGLKCTFNLNSNVIRKGVITDEQIKEKFLDRGHEIAVHGMLHVAPGMQRPIEGIKEVLNCRLELEERFGRIIRGMAYPDTGILYFENGNDYDTIKKYLTDLGIVYARSLAGDNNKFRMPTDWHNWIPTVHHSNPAVMDYIDDFLKIDNTVGYVSTRSSRLFYMWGHSFEFDGNDNWDLLDRICEKLGGHDDIWYATNIEIYEYVNAYNSLVHSADASMVYNPTLYTVWFEVDGTLYNIKPGETLSIDISAIKE